MFPWPGPSKPGESQWPTLEPRRVSEKGQMSYEGRVYGLGVECAGRVCWVEEAGERLIVHFADLPRVAVCR